MTQTFKIGTRGSPLALAQVELVKAALAQHHPDLQTQTVIIKTSGDWSPEHGEAPLKDVQGGKAQFAKEIEEALLAGAIDCAVHSMKDMDSHIPEGLTIDHMLPREDPRDAVLCRDGIDDLSKVKTLGTVSVRRAAFLKHVHPHLEVTPLRGNVQTRIDKLRAGQVDATLLALAGLKRLGLEHEADLILEPKNMLPAAGQGAVGIETRRNNHDTSAIFSQINDLNTNTCVTAERAAVRALDGSCHAPIGAYAIIEKGQLWLRVRVTSIDGTQDFQDEIRGTPEHADTLGTKLGQTLKSTLPSGILT